MVPTTEVINGEVWLETDDALINLSDVRCILPRTKDEKIFLEFSFKGLSHNDWIRIFFDTEKNQMESFKDISELVKASNPSRNDLKQFME